MQAAAWEKYSPMPLLSCHLLICQNRENRLGQDAMPITGAAVMIPIASSTPALETRMLIADIMEAAGMIIVSCVGITTHCMRDGWRGTISQIAISAPRNSAVIHGIDSLQMSFIINRNICSIIMVKTPLMGMHCGNSFMSFSGESLCRNCCEDKKSQKNCGQWLDLFNKQRSFFNWFFAWCLLGSAHEPESVEQTGHVLPQMIFMNLPSFHVTTSTVKLTSIL